MNIAGLSQKIIQKRSEVPAMHAMLVGISGIDGSGKGCIANLPAERLESRGFEVAVINVDKGLNPPSVRFDPSDLPGNFYRNGLRSNEMFERQILPLRGRRSVMVGIDAATETGSHFATERIDFFAIDFIVLEDIFVFKRGFVDLFDHKIWTECSFDVAPERAPRRSQEGLQPDETARAYRTIYFPAQRLHFDIDGPSDAAGLVCDNN